MDDSRSCLNWAYFNQGNGIEDLRYNLLYTTMELETAKVAAQEEISRREEQLTYLKDLLNRVISERDEAKEQFHNLLIDKLLLQQQQQVYHQPLHQITYVSGLSSIEDEAWKRGGGGGDSSTGISSSDCQESIVSSPVMAMAEALDPIPLPPPPLVHLTPEKPLPEKGKFLQAVMNAGPLLQTLLLAGPLPQWKHPPPPLESIEIPPVGVAIPSPSAPPPPPSSPAPTPFGINVHGHNCGGVNKRKRSLVVCEGSDSSINSHKYQRVILH